MKSDIISHGNNSHTSLPSIAFDQCQYEEPFHVLNGLYMIDFPGMFDNRGTVIDII